MKVNLKFYKYTLFISLFWQDVSALNTVADNITIDSEKGIYTLIGNAVAEEEGKTFNADKIVVYKKDNEKRPSKIEAFGNVVYKDESTTITSDHCESDMDFVTFSTNVILKGPDFGTIRADNAKYDTKNKTMDITAKKRVQLDLDEGLESEFNKKNKKQ